MACRCEQCGKPAACGEKYCDQCLMDMCCKTDTDRNIYSGGRFYGEKLDIGNQEVNNG